MPVFSYKVRGADGNTQAGTVEAESEELLRKRFEEQGLVLTEVTQVRRARKGAAGFGRVKLTSLSIFCRQFSTMVDAGVSLVRCLDVLSEQCNDAKLKRILIDVGERVEGGESLSRAMSRHPRAFSKLFIGLIRAGEVGGVLEESLQRLSHFLEKDVELRRKVRASLTYPTIVVVFALVVVIGLVVGVIPRFAELYKDLNIKEFPWGTQILIDLSHSLISRWWLFVGILVAILIAWKSFASTRFGRRVIDRMKLKLPVFGPLHHKICLARFSRTMGTLLSSGVPILQAMETVAETVGNNILADAILEARARIREGDRIGDPLEASGMFPPMVVHMIGVGEESGSLDFMLQKIADFYEQEVDSTIASLTSAIEPVLIVFLGVVVGFIVISLFMPLVKVIESLSSN
ncbi:MAG: type II secretion system F family protein [Fimbriimonadia bacterium]|jgi:type IV pilus assembly protein PilC